MLGGTTLALLLLALTLLLVLFHPRRTQVCVHYLDTRAAALEGNLRKLYAIEVPVEVTTQTLVTYIVTYAQIDAYLAGTDVRFAVASAHDVAIGAQSTTRFIALTQPERPALSSTELADATIFFIQQCGVVPLDGSTFDLEFRIHLRFSFGLVLDFNATVAVPCVVDGVVESTTGLVESTARDGGSWGSESADTLVRGTESTVRGGGYLASGALGTLAGSADSTAQLGPGSPRLLQKQQNAAVANSCWLPLCQWDACFYAIE